jgi:hypothetical protein
LVYDGVGGEDSVFAKLVELGKRFIDTIATAMKPYWIPIRDSFTDIFNSIKAAIEGSPLYQALKETAEKMLQIIGDALKKGGSWLLQQMFAGMGIKSWKDLLPKWDIPGIPGLATGGFVSQKGLYGLAENGPETVIPARHTRTFMQLLKAFTATKTAPTIAARPTYDSSSLYNSRTYNLNMATAKSSGNVAHDFAIMEVLAG